MKKGQFASKGKTILGDKPSGLGDVLDTPSLSPPATIKQAEADPVKSTQAPKTDARETKSDESASALKKGIRETVNTAVRTAVKPDPEELPPQREEFRFPGTLSERLRTYCFNTRTKKTATVIDALDEYLKDKGY
jgi:hypothetical protein